MMLASMNPDFKQHLPLLLVPALILLALPFIGSLPTWVTLTIAGLAMGMIIFVIASGLTLIFGLMDVLNFGHGAFIATGAYVAAAVMMLMPEALASTSLWSNLLALVPAMLAVARAIVEPRKLLLIDEPTKGLAPAIIGHMIDAFKELKASGATILLVEQNFNFARQLGDSVAVMDDGRIVHRGRMDELAHDEALQTRLLGLSLGAHQ